MKFFLLCVIFLSILSSCSNRYVSPAWFSTACDDVRADYYINKCKVYGLKKGTSEMSKCVQRQIDRGWNRACISNKNQQMRPAYKCYNRGGLISCY